MSTQYSPTMSDGAEDETNDEARTIRAREITVGMHLAPVCVGREFIGPRITKVESAEGWYGYVTVRTVNGGAVTFAPHDMVRVLNTYPHVLGATVAWQTRNDRRR